MPRYLKISRKINFQRHLTLQPHKQTLLCNTYREKNILQYFEGERYYQQGSW